MLHAWYFSSSKSHTSLTIGLEIEIQDITAVIYLHLHLMANKQHSCVNFSIAVYNHRRSPSFVFFHRPQSHGICCKAQTWSTALNMQCLRPLFLVPQKRRHHAEAWIFLTVPHPGHNDLIPSYKYIIDQVCSFMCSLKLLKGDFSECYFLFNIWTIL